MGSIKGASKLNLTPKEKHMVGDYILKHCIVPEGKEYARWDDESGGTDVSATEKLRPTIPKISVFHVRYLRQAFGLALESAKVFFETRKRHEEKLSEADKLRDKVEALIEHVKMCDVRIKDHEARLQTLEDKYTTPKK